MEDFRQVNTNELKELQLEDCLRHRTVTPFYEYMRDKLSIKQHQMPSFSHLEVVAALQEDWASESTQTKADYQRKASDHNKKAKNALPQMP